MVKNKEKIKEIRKKSNQFVVVCGPSGSGKTMVIKHLVDNYGFLEPSFFTTRELRSGEKEIGGTYLNHNEFMEKAMGGEVFLGARNYGNAYGYDLDKVYNDVMDGGNFVVEEYCAILLYPKKMKPISKVMDDELNKKEGVLLKNIDIGWGDIKEDMLKTKIIPAINRKDFSPLFKAINMYTIGAYGEIPEYFKFRWKSYNFPFDSFIYDIFSKLFGTLKINENCFFVSSNGPLVVVITKHYKKAVHLLKDLNKDFFIKKATLSNEINNYKLIK